MKVSTVEQMRSMDRSAVSDFGIGERLLMENAALAACSVLDRKVGIAGRKILVFCGGGNNGGDGFAVARKCLSMGGIPKVFLLSSPDRFKGSAKENLETLSRLPVDVIPVDSAESLGHDLAHCDVIVDALLGTGLDREVTGLFAEVIRRINETGKKVLSLDIPSGVNGDTGEVMGCSIVADYTVTFGLPKAGNLLMPGHHLCGDLFVTHISFPPRLFDSPDIRLEINTPPALPARNPDGHKGTFGEALFIAGASGYLGAPYLSAMSFLKAGGGYSRLACPEGIMPFIASKGSEIVCIPLKQTLSGSISYKNKEALLRLADKVDIVIMGPGLSLNDETSDLARELAVEINKPLILDADGIAAVSMDPLILKKRTCPTVLTPHLGEMSRITMIPAEKIASGKIPVLMKTAQDLNAIIVLKGANSLIGYPDGRIFINMSGNSGMATAGSGDVLTGTIAAMTGLGLDMDAAVRKGVFLHGAAGDLAAGSIGQDGMTAGDILEHLAEALRMDREGMLNDLYRGAESI